MKAGLQKNKNQGACDFPDSRAAQEAIPIEKVVYKREQSTRFCSSVSERCGLMQN
jgi:hypothetical protein